MNHSPFKTFVKFRKVEPTYEDDCQIYYPTPWDRDYLAYHHYCQQHINEMELATYYADISHNEEMQQYFEDCPLYEMSSFFCRDEQNYGISPEFDEQSAFVPFDSSDVIKIYDKTEHYECSDSQQEESDTDVIENDSDVRFNLNRVDRGTANYDEFEEDQSHCEGCERGRRCRKPPSILNLGVFLSNLRTKPQVLKRRKVKQFHSRKFEEISRNSSTSFISIVKSDINIEEMITVEDCACNEIPTDDTRKFKMTYSQAIHRKSSKFTLIANTSNAETDFKTIQMNQIAAKNSKTYKTYSQALYCNLPKSKIIKEKQSKEEVNLHTTQINSVFEQTTTKDVRTSRTYSEVVHNNLLKSRLCKPQSSNKNPGLGKTNIQNVFDQVAVEVKNYKTSYSEAVHHNLPKSNSSKETSTEKKSTTCNTYSKAIYCTVSKSRLIKKTSSNKEVGFNTGLIDKAFDQPPSDVKTSKTFSQAVSCGAPKLGNDFYQIPVKKINATTTKKIKSQKTKMNKAELNKIPMNDIGQAISNSLPETSLIGQKTSENKISISPLWSKIVSEGPKKTITYEIDSNTDGKSEKCNTIKFCQDTIEMEIIPNIPISPTFHVVSGEIHAISSVHDKTATYELDTKDIPEMDKITNVSTCQTWSQIVTGEKIPAESFKCNEDISDTEKKVMPICPIKIASGTILGTGLACDETLQFKKDSNNEAKLKMKKKPRFVKLDVWSTSPLEKTVKKPAELKHTDPSLFSYANIIKMTKTDASCVKPAPAQRDILSTSPKYRSPMDSSPTSQPTYSDPVKTTASFSKNANSATCNIPSKNKEKWILKESKHKRSKKSKT